MRCNSVAHNKKVNYMQKVFNTSVSNKVIVQHTESGVAYTYNEHVMEFEGEYEQGEVWIDEELFANYTQTVAGLVVEVDCPWNNTYISVTLANEAEMEVFALQTLETM